MASQYHTPARDMYVCCHAHNFFRLSDQLATRHLLSCHRQGGAPLRLAEGGVGDVEVLLGVQQRQAAQVALLHLCQRLQRMPELYLTCHLEGMEEAEDTQASGRAGHFSHYLLTYSRLPGHTAGASGLRSACAALGLINHANA